MRLTETESRHVVGETVRFIYNGKLRQGTIECISEYTSKRTIGQYSCEHGYIKVNHGNQVKTYNLSKIEKMVSVFSMFL
jgi:hypothetical protein